MSRSRAALRALTAAVACVACSSHASSPDPSSALDSDAGDCSDRAGTVSAGLREVSSDGYVFELTALTPDAAVQSAGPPGNTWTFSVTDRDGAPVSGGALVVTSYMPDHGHSGPPAVAVERDPGTYEVDDLVLPMPALYQITPTLTLASGERESVVVTLCLNPS